MSEYRGCSCGPDNQPHLHTVFLVCICQLCRRRVFRQRNGAWYHRHNGSVACRPGEGSDARATPLQVEPRSEPTS